MWVRIGIRTGCRVTNLALPKNLCCFPRVYWLFLDLESNRRLVNAADMSFIVTVLSVPDTDERNSSTRSNAILDWSGSNIAS